MLGVNVPQSSGTDTSATHCSVETGRWRGVVEPLARPLVSLAGGASSSSSETTSDGRRASTRCALAAAAKTAAPLCGPRAESHPRMCVRVATGTTGTLVGEESLNEVLPVAQLCPGVSAPRAAACLFNPWRSTRVTSAAPTARAGRRLASGEGRNDPVADQQFKVYGQTYTDFHDDLVTTVSIHNVD